VHCRGGTGVFFDKDAFAVGFAREDGSVSGR